MTLVPVERAVTRRRGTPPATRTTQVVDVPRPRNPPARRGPRDTSGLPSLPTIVLGGGLVLAILIRFGARTASGIGEWSVHRFTTSLTDAFWAVVGTFVVSFVVTLLLRSKTPTPAQWSARKAAAFKSSRVPTGWKNSTRKHIAVHEAGHHGVGTALGKKCKSYVFDRNEGGFCAISSWWKDPVDNIAFLLAGGMAANSQRGCSADNKMIKGFLKSVPAGQQAKALTAARQRASWGLAKSSGLRSRVAHVLFERGWFE